MSAGSLPSDSQVRDPGYPTPSENYLTNSKGILSWVFTLDHKRIGVMYLVGVTLAFAIAGLLALLIRLHLFQPDGFVFTGEERTTGTTRCSHCLVPSWSFFHHPECACGVG